MSIDIAGIGSVANLAASIVERLWPKAASETEKATAQLEIQKLLEVRENTVIQAQKEIIVSEMQQQDSYTKRARPTIVYSGLAFIFMVHVVFPFITWFGEKVLPPVSLPEEFWWAWTGAVGIWMVGRTMEKRGIGNGIASKITGGK